LSARRAALAAAAVLALAFADGDRPPEGAVDPDSSSVEVQVSRSGVFSIFGHDHRIVAPVSAGTVTSEGGPRVELAFDARSLRVVDADLADRDRRKVQATMEGPEVLDADRYPDIIFRSTGVDAVDNGRWSVEGTLTVHGETHLVLADVALSGGRYRGSAAFKLSDFAIRPPKVAGGAVQVRDEVRIVFDVSVASAGSSSGGLGATARPR